MPPNGAQPSAACPATGPGVLRLAWQKVGVQFPGPCGCRDLDGVNVWILFRLRPQPGCFRESRLGKQRRAALRVEGANFGPRR